MAFYCNLALVGSGDHKYIVFLHSKEKWASPRGRNQIVLIQSVKYRYTGS